MQQDQATVVHSFFVWNTWRWSHFPHVSAACFLPFLIVQQYSPQVIRFYHFVSFNVKRVSKIRPHVPKLKNNSTERKVVIESVTSNLTSETITTIVSTISWDCRQEIARVDYFSFCNCSNQKQDLFICVFSLPITTWEILTSSSCSCLCFLNFFLWPGKPSIMKILKAPWLFKWGPVVTQTKAGIQARCFPLSWAVLHHEAGLWNRVRKGNDTYKNQQNHKAFVCGQPTYHHD